MSIYPAIFGFMGGAIMLYYPLRDVTMIKIEEELLARKENEE